jgi:hypothetical protein
MQSAGTARVLAWLAALCMVACGKEPILSPAAGSAERSLKNYMAILEPVPQGPGIAAPSGRATVSIDARGVVEYTISVRGLSPGDVHLQALQGRLSGEPALCPRQGADANGDAYVDAAELGAYAGEVMLPLADEPGIRPLSASRFPLATPDGELYFARRVPALDVQRIIGEPSSGLVLERFTVVLYGVSPEVALPDTLTPLGDLSPHVAVPVACGELTRLD